MHSVTHYIIDIQHTALKRPVVRAEHAVYM